LAGKQRKIARGVESGKSGEEEIQAVFEEVIKKDISKKKEGKGGAFHEKNEPGRKRGKKV